MIRVSASLANGVVKIALANDDPKQEVVIGEVVVSGPEQFGNASPVLSGAKIILAPKGSRNAGVVFDVTKTIKGRFKGDGDGEIMISLVLTPEPADQPDHYSYQVSIKNGHIAAFS